MMTVNQIFRTSHQRCHAIGSKNLRSIMECHIKSFANVFEGSSLVFIFYITKKTAIVNLCFQFHLSYENLKAHSYWMFLRNGSLLFLSRQIRV